MKAVTFAIGAFLLLASPASAQFENVGVIDFPTSATAKAQKSFLRGVAILHSFGWKQAISEFQTAQELDPDFALAYWGETLCYNHPLQNERDADSPRRVLERLGPTREERLAKAPTERERGLLGAVESLWGEGEWRERRVLYMDAMSQLYERYPDDDEIATFYALSMLSGARALRDDSLRLEIRAGTIALDVFNRRPKHPGAAHYVIHSFDDPTHAPLALQAAFAFAEIAPSVSHARHMPTHIFIQHGMWDYVSNHNQSAYGVARDLWQPGDNVGDGVHALDWGQYGDLQRGDYVSARQWIDRLQMVIDTSDGQTRAVNTLPLVKARYIVETEEWKEEPISKESSAHMLLAVGLSALRTGNLETARQAEVALAERVAEGDDAGSTRDGVQWVRVMHKEIKASIRAAQGMEDEAIQSMDEALEILDSLRLPNGAANPVKPAYELYGEILLQLNQPDEAVKKFEISLQRMPNRPRSLLGLARALVGAGEYVRAAEQYRELTRVWQDRESFPGIQEAQKFLQSNSQ